MPASVRAALVAIPLVLAMNAAFAQESAEWSRSPGMNSATMAIGDQYELIGTASGSNGGDLVVITHWKRRSDTGIDAALGGPQVLVRCLDIYDAELSVVGSTCFIPLK